MIISNANAQSTPKIFPHIQQKLKDIQSEKAITYSDRIFKRLPGSAAVNLQRIKGPILEKSQEVWGYQPSKKPSQILNPTFRGLLAAPRIFLAINK